MIMSRPPFGNFYTKSATNRAIAQPFSQDKGHKRVDRIWFWSDGIKQTQESIDLLATPDICRMPLGKIGRKIHKPGRFDFWRMVFENRERIPKNELLSVWFDCLSDRPRSVSETKVETPDEMLEFKYRLVKPGKPEPSDEKIKIITDFHVIKSP